MQQSRISTDWKDAQLADVAAARDGLSAAAAKLKQSVTEALIVYPLMSKHDGDMRGLRIDEALTAFETEMRGHVLLDVARIEKSRNMKDRLHSWARFMEVDGVLEELADLVHVYRSKLEDRLEGLGYDSSNLELV